MRDIREHRANGQRRRAYLIHEPYDPDAIRMIRTIFTYFGLRPICLHGDPKARFYGERAYPVLRTSLVEASYDADPDDLADLVDRVSVDYDIVGVVPWNERFVGPSAELCGLLGLGWNDADVLARFRDKNALKDHVRAVAPDVRVPEHRLVRSVADLESGPIPDRFVLKPNDGYGNRDIGMFSADDLDAARVHIQSDPCVVWILEEYIGGIEYHIDGQVRGPGEVVTLGIWEYIRTEVNGYATVYVGEVQINTDEPRFAELTDYAERLLAATGLQRCPFHLEAKVDERGPCVIDLGARFPSDGGPDLLGRLHPSRPDPFAVAAADYLGGDLLQRDSIDWTHYDSVHTVYAYGISTECGYLGSIVGKDTVEAMPEFTYWIVEPKIGDRLVETKELRDAPYIAALTCDGSREDAFALIDRVRDTVQIHACDRRRDSIDAVGRNVERRVKPKLRWVGHRVARALVPTSAR